MLTNLAQLLVLLAASGSVVVAVILGCVVRSAPLAVRLVLCGPLLCLATGPLLLRWPPLKPTFDLLGGTILVYEASPLERGGEVNVEAVADRARQMASVAAASPVGAEVVGGNRFVLKLPEPAVSTKRIVAGRIRGASGEVLAMRIVALPGQDDDLLDDQPLDPSKPIVDEELGMVIGSWALLDDGLFEEAEESTDPPTAFIRAHDGKRYILLLQGPYDVTGGDLAVASADVDELLRPQVSFTLTAKGAKQMEMLTSNNLGRGQTYRSLAIVVGGVVVSAPKIRGTIFQYGRISGNFTKEEVEQMVAALSLGSLDAQVKLVKERSQKADEGARFEIAVLLTACALAWLATVGAMAAIYRAMGIALVAGSVMQLLVTLGLLAVLDVPLTNATCAAVAAAVFVTLGGLWYAAVRIGARQRRGELLAEAIPGGCRASFWPTVVAHLASLVVGAALVLLSGDRFAMMSGAILILGTAVGLFARFTLARAALELVEIALGRENPASAAPSAARS